MPTGTLVTKTVAHLALDYGLPSETFVADAVKFTEVDGWKSVLLTGSLHNREWFPFPDDSLIHVSARPSLPWRAYQRLRLGHDADSTSRRLWPRMPDPSANIVHAHFGWSAMYAAGVAERCRVPLVTTFHASDLSVFPHLHGLDRSLGKLQGRNHRLDRTLHRVDLAITIADWVTDDLRALGYRGRIEQIPVGVDLDRFNQRDERPPASPLRILIVGRLITRKGVDRLIDAIALAGDRLPPTDLTVIGDGPERSRLESMARNRRVKAAFLGARPHEEVADAMRASDLLVLSSRTTARGEKEGAPMVLKEAMAIGVPVVTTDNGGSRSVMPPEFRHEVVPEDDAQALANSLVAIVEEPWPSVKRRVSIGRAWVEREFDAREIGKRTVALYESLIEETAGSPAT